MVSASSTVLRGLRVVPNRFAPQLTGGAIQPETSEGEEARSRVGGHIGIHAAF
jgi:hypothetical protein